MKKHVPNIITLLNLVSGILSIYLYTINNIEMAAWFIFIAAVFDFMDGFAAKILDAKSEIGAQLDSLCDIVSFGVAPGFILFYMIDISIGQYGDHLNNLFILPFLAFLIPIFGALRLAIFNTDEEQVISFKGLPVPAMAILIASLPLIRSELYVEGSMLYTIITNTYFLLTIAVFGSLLMVSRLPMFAMKFQGIDLKRNKTRYLFILLSLFAVIFLEIVAVPFIILLYIVMSFTIYIFNPK
ncbi:MAG: CDP-alcohol phosphatidyltransferase family protein [Bacteroidales bacterium]|mgnify:CR=1 FL=1|jgi:CDP-diacylglycerol---serine O-phosphatidyltransferase|nr:hypothetical protein [Lentimicrobiaceae bacterium]MDG1136395.1 CDP-alcohol phosphatidyltransferase family protein [Bacteroidales bacterium]MDG1902311.1 CDP-alcohol phosphatidyltransferase family protein [Bacteroidales bacterium]MDG2081291.1 CDP-alcohol phosphatidyltransferase family protein [Bacteroidales bacterium]|tara:strand:+ start:25198 stop:25920 length:723 start_codon:yes stop_codon:yes gene_type:complete